MSADNTLKTLSNWQLKVGRISELNDPFEFIPGVSNANKNTSPGIVEQIQGGLLDFYNFKFGILCFSESIKDPVLWSHYADSHKGIALGFDYLMGPSILEVNYNPDRVTVDVNEFFNMPEKQQIKLVNSVLSSKAPSWAYEKEYRVLIELEDCELIDGLYFKTIPEDFLYEVVLGIRCEYEKDDFKKIVKNYPDVIVKKAKRNINQYKVDV
jgi:hypothetical protein